MVRYFSLYRFLFVIVTFVSVIAFVSCKKSLQDENKPSEETSISFRIAGVNSEISKTKLETTNKVAFSDRNYKSSYSDVKTISKNVSLEVGNSVEDITSPFDNMSNKIVLGKEGISSKDLGKSASVTALPSSVKFRIVLINSNGDIVYNVQATSNEMVTFNLTANEAYSWYAYSYGTEDDIPVANASEEVLTPIDKDFLYAKSTAPFTAQPSYQPINIIFDHQVALVSVELDYDRLYAQIPTNTANSSSISDNFNWSFNVAPDFLYKGVFSLRTGQVSNYESYAVDLNQILEDHPTAKNVKLAKMYTTGPSAGFNGPRSFSVSLDLLKVRYPNTPVGGPLVNLFEPSNTFQRVFNFNLGAVESGIGKNFVAKFKLKYTFPQLSILHVTSVTGFGYAAEAVSTRSSYNMLQAAINFGTNDNSIVRSGGFVHRASPAAGGLAAALYLGGGATLPPDIVILGVDYVLTNDDVTSLVAYLERGGVLFLMSGGVTTTSNNLSSHQSFLRSLFVNQTIETIESSHIGGSVYQLTNYNDGILNGPFGNIQTAHWGKHNGPNTNSNAKTIVLRNLSASDMVQYSGSNPINSTDNVSTGATMIKHKQKHFFWVGDAGFIAYNAAYGSASQTTYETRYPFATSDPIATRYIPEPRYFGRAGGGLFDNNTLVYNSTIFANFMSWAIANATFFGINNGGLGSGPYHEF